MIDTKNSVPSVAARIAVRLLVPCFLFSCGIMFLWFFPRVLYVLVRGGELPGFGYCILLLNLFGSLGLIAGCTTKSFALEEPMKADYFGVSGLCLGFLRTYNWTRFDQRRRHRRFAPAANVIVNRVPAGFVGGSAARAVPATRAPRSDLQSPLCCGAWKTLRNWPIA